MSGLGRNSVLPRDEFCIDESYLDEGVECRLLRRAHDGEVIRVGDRYLWRSPGGHLRGYCHEPLEILVVLRLLTDTDTSPRVRVLTDSAEVPDPALATPAP